MTGDGKRVTIFIGETDQWHHRPAYMAILELLRSEGCAGATVARGIAGFGANSRIKTASLLELSVDLPIIITWIDRDDRVQPLLPRIAEMVPGGLIAVDDVSVYQYSSTLHEGLPALRVADAMTRTVTTIDPEAPLFAVVEKLLDKPYRALPVVDASNTLVGIISDTDLLQRGGMQISISLKSVADPGLARELIARLRQEDRIVSQIMTRDPVTIGATASLSEAARVMRTRDVKRLPVVDDNGRLVGILSRFDILKTLPGGHLPQAFFRKQPADAGAPFQTVSDVMNAAVATGRPETLLHEILDILANDASKRVVITGDERHVLGIISDTDLLARLNPESHPGILERLVSKLPLGHFSADARSHLEKARGKTAGELMTGPVTTVLSSEPIGSALATATEKHLNWLPVVDQDDKLIGIVSRGELFRAFIDETAAHQQS
jgi:CBS-domain-containing membrane protein